VASITNHYTAKSLWQTPQPPQRGHRIIDVATASRRNAARHRLLTAAPVPLERVHLCCKGSCEFVESSHRTVLLRKFSPTMKFWILQK
jgi:hypothetical protein